ncbi:DUF6612 family protein [Gemella sp. zg-570]|uniref:DUF6612 family protein n=1 Tax=Gemella sp. zg-570 TaxID=2840371 RepID=UPI00352D5671
MNEKDGKYQIVYEGTDEQYKDIIKDALENSSAREATDLDDAIENIEIKSASMEYLVNKNTFQIISATTKAEFYVLNKGQRSSEIVTMISETEFSNINNVAEIILPAEALNAQVAYKA